MRRFVASIFVLTLATGLTAGGAVVDPHVPDDCGDADVMVRAGDTIVPTPDATRAAGFDIEAAWFEDFVDDNGRHDGVRVNLQTCGAVATPDPSGGYWGVTWAISDSCSRTVAIGDAPTALGGVVRRATLSSTCTRPSAVLPGGTEAYTEWSMQLPAPSFSVDGDVISWVLTTGLVTEELRSRLAFLLPGSTWTWLGAHARDGRQLTIASGNLPPAYHLSGPGAMDDAASERSFTVGA